MTNRPFSHRYASLAAFLAIAGLTLTAVADGPAKQPATAAFNPVMADVVANQRRFSELFPHTADLANPNKRAASGAEARDALTHVVTGLRSALLKSRSATQPSTEAQYMGDSLNGYESMLVALGDQPTLAALDKREKGDDAEDALRARRIQLLGNWFAAGPDAAKQLPLVDQATSLTQTHPTDVGMTDTVSALLDTAATPDISDRLKDVIINHMNNTHAERIKRNLASQAKANALVGRPMTLNGKKPDGQAFSTDDWKGRVVLVDFWASWCGPCKAELPRVRKMYDEYHAQGFEVLGVSNDYKVEALTGYAAAQGLEWPQLFDADAAADRKWNPTTIGYGINSIPRMFLIDKKGICRSITARSDFEIEIPKLLAESK